MAQHPRFRQATDTVTLIDGTVVDSSSEAWRHECEARHVANLPTRAARHDYIAAVIGRRGPQAGKALHELASRIFNTDRQRVHE